MCALLGGAKGRWFKSSRRRKRGNDGLRDITNGMAFGRPGLLVTLVFACLSAVFATSAAAQPWLRSAEIVVPSDLENQDCRTGVCKHNENTDLTRWRGAIYFVHRTAGSQVLGPNSSLRVYRSKDQGETFQLQAIIPAPPDRDIRDPAFYTVGNRLYIKAITRLPGFSLRDTGVDSISVETHSTDARSWSPLRAIGPVGWGFWRVVEHHGAYYSAAYETATFASFCIAPPTARRGPPAPRSTGSRRIRRSRPS